MGRVSSLSFHSAWKRSSPWARVLTNTMVVRAWRMRSRIAGAEARPMCPDQGIRSPSGSRMPISGGAPSGTSMRRGAGPPVPIQSRSAPLCATVADRPTRRMPGARAASRARPRASWSPRFVPARACTSSTTAQLTPPNSSGASGKESMRARLSGVVSRMLGGASRWRRRRLAGVSPVRVSTVTGRFMSATGARRLRAMSVASALRGLM